MGTEKKGKVIESSGRITYPRLLEIAHFPPLHCKLLEEKIFAHFFPTDLS